jgi:transposase-like protein
MARFLGTLEHGLSISAAVRKSGASRRSVYYWRDQFPDFATAWTQAEQDGLDRHEDRIAVAGNYDWRASLAFLRAKRPAVWGNRVTTAADATVKLDAKLDVDARIAELLQMDAAWLANRLDTTLPGMD